MYMRAFESEEFGGHREILRQPAFVEALKKLCELAKLEALKQSAADATAVGKSQKTFGSPDYTDVLSSFTIMMTSVAELEEFLTYLRKTRLASIED